MFGELIDRYTEDLKGRVRLAVGRCLLTMINDAGPVQVVQCGLLADEPQDDLEHVQHYGYASHPHAGAEGVALFVGGNRDHGVVIATNDRRYRLRSLASGEVALYDDLDHVILLGRDGIKIDGAGQVITLTNAPKVRIESDVDVTGEIRDRCDTEAKSMSDMRQHQTGHTHKTNAIGEQTDSALQEI